MTDAKLEGLMQQCPQEIHQALLCLLRAHAFSELRTYATGVSHMARASGFESLAQVADQIRRI